MTLLVDKAACIYKTSIRLATPDQFSHGRHARFALVSHRRQASVTLVSHGRQARGTLVSHRRQASVTLGILVSHGMLCQCHQVMSPGFAPAFLLVVPGVCCPLCPTSSAGALAGGCF
jgi:hypothetical protein